jgi:hypothetical protein
MDRPRSRRMQACVGVTPPNAWAPPGMLALTIATYAVAFGLVFMLFLATGPSGWLSGCLNAETLGGIHVIGWITIANIGWAVALLADASVKLVARRYGCRDEVRSMVLTLMGIIILAGMQLAVEALRLVVAAS